MNTVGLLSRVATLATISDDELIGETESPQARALLERIVGEGRSAPASIRSRRLWSPIRRQVIVPALSVTAIGALVVGLLTFAGSKPDSAAAMALRAAARAARSQQQLVIGPGQYLYTKSVGGDFTILGEGADNVAYSAVVPTTREVWESQDGGRMHTTTGDYVFLSAADRQGWLAAGSPSEAGASNESDVTLPPGQGFGSAPASSGSSDELSSDPAELYTQLKAQAAGYPSDRLNLEIFTLIGDSLRYSNESPEQRAALYTVASKLPGVELRGTVHDSAGREGTAVAMDDAENKIKHTLIFDASTSALLGEEDTTLPGFFAGYAPGTRLSYATYVTEAVVGSDTARP